MSLNVNTSLYSLNGIDVNSVAKVSKEILARAASSQKEPQVVGLDYSKFNRAALGVDLYSSRTNPELQKQIALTQAGLYAQAVNVAKLNSAAAANLYSASAVQKNVEMTQSTTINEIASPRRVEEDDKKIIELFNITDGKSSSANGFNPFADKEADSEKGEK